MKTENKATPRPWKVQDTEYPEFVIAPDEMVVCQMRGWGALQHKFDNPTDIANVQKANVELIVKAVNAYDSLVEENKKYQEAYIDSMRSINRLASEKGQLQADNQKLRELLEKIKDSRELRFAKLRGELYHPLELEIASVLTKAKNVSLSREDYTKEHFTGE